MVAICNRHHSLDQRLCRWLLSCMDRLPTDELTMTQDAIGIMLGVRRMGVTEALGQLPTRLIHCGRTHGRARPPAHGGKHSTNATG